MQSVTHPIDTFVYNLSGNFEILLPLLEASERAHLCGLFSIEEWSRSGTCLVNNIHTSPARLGVRVFQSCHGRCNFCWCLGYYFLEIQKFSFNGVTGWTVFFLVYFFF